MPVIFYYDKEGVPIDMRTAARLVADMTYKRVARTTIVSAAEPATAFDVSTVWLGTDHSGGDGPPLIFETMVFADSWDDLDCRRYSTKAQAIAGHHEMIAMVASTLDDPIVMDAEPLHDPTPKSDP